MNTRTIALIAGGVVGVVGLAYAGTTWIKARKRAKAEQAVLDAMEELCGDAFGPEMAANIKKAFSEGFDGFNADMKNDVSASDIDEEISEAVKEASDNERAFDINDPKYAELIKLFKGFDFTYSFSDDINVYTKWNTRKKELRAHAKGMGFSELEFAKAYRTLSGL